MSDEESNITSDRENFNDFPPESEEQLSPPIVSDPIYECAEAVFVHGFTPGAAVRVYADRNDLVGERLCHFGAAKIGLKRPLKPGEKVTATQSINNLISAHSLRPVTVEGLPESELQSNPPKVSKKIYECGRVVPVSDLTPSVKVQVADNNGVIGSESTGNGEWEAVVTSQLHASQPVRARELACDQDPDRRVTGPWSNPEPVKQAPSPVPKPVISKKSLVVGNDTVVLGNCLPGAQVTIEDGNTTISSGWYATSNWVRFPIDPPLKQNANITATQELCGNKSPPARETPTSDLAAPEVVEPICDGAQYVLIRNTIFNATVVLFENSTIIGYGGAGNGDVVLAVGGGQPLSEGDDISAVQYMGPTVSPRSNTVTVGSSLVGQPHVDIYGGEQFFNAETSAGEKQIDGPVFPRGRGPGPRFAVRSCCGEGDPEVVVEGPDDEIVAELKTSEVYPGYHTAQWNWQSKMNWDVPDEVPIGEYRVHVSTECEQDDATVPFYVIFNPDDVNGPERFSFNEIAVWFGTSTNRARALVYHLHPDDRRIFTKALNAANGETSLLQAAEDVADAEEQLFSYSLSYHTNDTIDMLKKYTSAQCADDAGFLTAMLRAIGIPAHPVTADAAKETGEGDWTFDTWVEFLGPSDGGTEWLVLHPHENISSPTSRRQFGTSVGVAVEGFNDVIVMGDANWKWNEVGDNVSDLSYDRNECQEPKRNLQKKTWVKELCEGRPNGRKGYWKTDHWACTQTSRMGLRAPDGFRFDWEEHEPLPLPPYRFNYLSEFGYRRFTGFEYQAVEQPQFGGTVSGSVPIRNDGEETREGRVTIEFVGYRSESKQFAETTFDTNAQRMKIEPGTEQSFRFELEMPETLEPGQQLYIRARMNESTIVLHELEPSSTIDCRLEGRRELSVGDEFNITGVIHNVGNEPLGSVRVDLNVPYFVEVDGEMTRWIDELATDTEHRINWEARALAAMEAGTITLDVKTQMDGSSRSGWPIRIIGERAAPDNSRVPIKSSG
jgi:hypothetical protein